MSRVGTSVLLVVVGVCRFPICFCRIAREYEHSYEAEDVCDSHGNCHDDAILPALVERPLLKTSIEEEDGAFGAAG